MIKWYDVLIFARLLFVVELIILGRVNKLLHDKIISSMLIEREV